MSATNSTPLNDAIIVALAQLVDDSQSGRREPSHDDLNFLVQRSGVTDGDPKSAGQTVGKTKRVRAVLSWALEYNIEGGKNFAASLLGFIRGHGGFRPESPNYVGGDAIKNISSAFNSEGYELTLDGELRPVLLDNLSGAALTDALKAYVRRAKLGADDAALVTGTAKDLLEATAAHVLQQKYGSYSSAANFPTLLGQAFVALDLATTEHPVEENELPTKRVERAMFELACAINRLRNRDGTGHGRPWLPYVGDSEAKLAIESMGIIAERLLAAHAGDD